MIELATAPGVVAALSEGQRAVAHLVVLLVVPVVIGLLLTVRRVRVHKWARRGQRMPEEEH
jgi:hypothetical protein